LKEKDKLGIAETEKHWVTRGGHISSVGAGNGALPRERRNKGRKKIRLNPRLSREEEEEDIGRKGQIILGAGHAILIKQ